MNTRLSIGLFRQSFSCMASVLFYVFLPINMAVSDELDDAIKNSQRLEVAPLIDRKQFVRKRSIRHTNLSPDNNRISFIVRHKRHDEIWLYDLAKQSYRKLFSGKGIKQSYWSTDSEFIFITNDKGVSGIDIKPASIPTILVNLDELRDEYFYAVDSTHPRAFIASLKQPETSKHELTRFDHKGSKLVLYSNKSRVSDYLFNKQGRLVVIRLRNGEGHDLIDLTGEKEALIKHCHFYDTCSLQYYYQETGSLLIKARFGEDLDSLFKIDLASKDVSLIHQDPMGKFDLNDVTYDEAGQPQYAHYQAFYNKYYGLNKAFQSKLNSLYELLQDLTPQSKDFEIRMGNRLWLVFDQSSNNSVNTSYLYDTTNNKLRDVFSPAPKVLEKKFAQIKRHHVAPNVAVEYEASDGMKQFGYVTLPIGRDISQVPLIILPHGGPWNRVNGGYFNIVQLLSNRGYAVFQPNFRSSTGMGKQYVLSANKDFGNGRVQQDIIDGMEYVLSRGVGDRNKLAIFGHSFGGFSTLSALSFTPNTFKVGIAGAPPTDLARSIRQLTLMPLNDQLTQRTIQMKNLAVDIYDKQAMQRLHLKSPRANWQKVERPLYLLAGGYDDRVAVQDVREYAVNLSQANKPVTLFIDEREGHSYQKPLAREAYAYIVEKALATHLKGQYQKAVSDSLKRYLKRNMVIDKNNLLAPKMDQPLK